MTTETIQSYTAVDTPLPTTEATALAYTYYQKKKKQEIQSQEARMRYSIAL